MTLRTNGKSVTMAVRNEATVATNNDGPVVTTVVAGGNRYDPIIHPKIIHARSQTGACVLASRKSTGKRLRFEVFKRDHFTCQYCGAQPPDVVLVCDHVTPVASGGATTIDNLITACETCNQGKAHIPLGNVVMRPDADMLYLEAQQEVAELRRYQAALAERDEVISELVLTYQDLWVETSGLDWAPSPSALRSFLTKYSPEITEEALLDVAVKVGSGYIRQSEYSNKWLSYMYAVARNIASERDEED